MDIETLEIYYESEQNCVDVLQETASYDGVALALPVNYSVYDLSNAEIELSRILSKVRM